jgi:hypothetical protein
LGAKRFYGTEVDGCRAVVDVATGVVHFDAMSGAKLKTDVILVPSQKNISEKPAPDYYVHKPTDFVLQGQREPLIPDEVLRRSRELIERSRFPSSVELTVGDLSTVAEDRRKHRVRDGKRFLKSMEKGLSIGDLTDKDEDRKGLDQLFVGRPVIEAAPTESGQIDAERVRKHHKQVDEALHIRNMLAGGKDELLERYADRYLRGKPEKESKQKN